MKITLDMLGGIVIDGVTPEDLPGLLKIVEAAQSSVGQKKLTTTVELSPKLHEAHQSLANGMLTVNGVAVELGISKPTAHRRIRKLIELGAARRIARGQYEAL